MKFSMFSNEKVIITLIKYALYTYKIRFTYKIRLANEARSIAQTIVIPSAKDPRFAG